MIALPSIVYGDIGPKPSIEIIVKNPPKVEYYLDLLVDYEGKAYILIFVRKINIRRICTIYLKISKSDGWRPAMVTGTKVPIFGDIIGKKMEKIWSIVLVI